MKKIHLILLLLVTFGSFAQTKVLFEVNFDTDSYSILKENETILNEKIILFKSKYKYSYKIEITGHTDNVGNYQYNKKLSENRAKSITDYLIKNGIPKYKITTKSESFSFPKTENNSEAGRQKNRRVEIEFTYEDEINLTSLKKFKRKPNSYFFDSQKEKTIVYSSGTIITIPKNAFVDQNGNAVTGEIEIRYQEFRNPVDFILSGIPMHIDSGKERGYFDSGGMFRILAFQNGNPLTLQEEIQVDFQLTDNLPNMNFYELDSLSNNWNERQRVTDGFGNRLFEYLVCGYFEYPDETTCYLEKRCDILYHIHKKGVEYAQSELSLLEMIYFTSPENFQKAQQEITKNQTKIKTNEKQIENLETKINQHKISYTLVKQSENSFSIEEENKKSKKQLKWISNSKLPDSIFTKKWKSSVIENTGKEIYAITLNDGQKELKLYNIFLDVSKRIKTKKKGKYLKNLVSDFNSRTSSFRKTQERKENLISNNENLIKKNEELGLLQVGDNNEYLNEKTKKSIECFYQYSKSEITEKDMEMNLDTWLKYFDANKKMMLERYSGLPETENYKICEQERIEREKQREERRKELERIWEEQRPERERIQRRNKKANQLLNQSFSLSRMGIYNFDVLYKMKETDVLFVEYQYNNEIIKPDFILVVNEKINGIIRFDNNGFGNSPFRFQYHSGSKNIIIAFDSEGEGYIFSSKDFRKLEQKNTERQTVNLKKINSVKDIENAL